MSESWFTRVTIPARDVKSLVFAGDRLVDWAAGGAVYHLDGTYKRAAVNYAYRFDAAVTSGDGRYTVLYERLGTKGLLLDSGQILRELNRSFYRANAYEYPACLFTLFDGRAVLAHCPEKYNQIELEDVATGQHLTRHDQRQPRDFFHSRR